MALVKKHQKFMSTNKHLKLLKSTQPFVKVNMPSELQVVSRKIDNLDMLQDFFRATSTLSKRRLGSTLLSQRPMPPKSLEEKSPLVILQQDERAPSRRDVSPSFQAKRLYSKRTPNMQAYDFYQEFSSGLPSPRRRDPLVKRIDDLVEKMPVLMPKEPKRFASQLR